MRLRIRRLSKVFRNDPEIILVTSNGHSEISFLLEDLTTRGPARCTKNIVSRNLLADWAVARGASSITFEYFRDGGKPSPEIDAFTVDAALTDAPIVFGRDAWALSPVVLKARTEWGLDQFATLKLMRDPLKEAETVGTDAPRWIWGPPARSGAKLYAAVAEMGRGYVVRRLREAGWGDNHLRKLMLEWLDAGNVHSRAIEPAVAAFLRPRAPRCVGRTEVRFIERYLAVAYELLQGDHPLLVKDLARLLAWIGARAQGTRLVSIPTEAITQGRGKKAHPDTVGITTQSGRKLWPIVRDQVLVRTRGHSAGNSVAEYEIHEQYADRIVAVATSSEPPSNKTSAA